MSTQPAIAIIGAGPGGLLLARLLHLAKIPATVYEGEPHRSSRAQGGSLDLHPESGQVALRHAQLFSEFQAIARSEGEDMRIADNNGNLYWEEVDSERHDRPEVDRAKLRGILLDSLPKRAVQWGCKVQSINRTEEGQHAIRLNTASGVQISQPYDLIVGADGAWSKVRPLLSTVKPHYSTISMLDCRIHSVDSLYPQVSALVGQGSYIALSSGKAMIAQRNGDGSIHIYAMIQAPESWLKDVGVDWTDAERAKKFLLEEVYEGWDGSLKDLIRYAGPDIVPRALYMLPTDFQWESKQGLTMLGDAAHLMTPFAGEGVNLAMLDALELSQAIVKASGGTNITESTEDEDVARGPSFSMFDAVQSYESKMFTRSHKSMQETWHNLELFFKPDAPKEFVSEFKEMMQQHTGEPIREDVVPNYQA